MKIIKMTQENNERLGALIQFALKGAQAIAIENATKQVQDMITDINNSMEDHEDDKQIQTPAETSGEANTDRKDGGDENQDSTCE